MITVEKSDPFSSESHRLVEVLSAELAAITGDNGKSNFTVEAMSDDNASWALAKNSQGKALGCGAIRPLTKNIAEIKRMFSDRSASGIGVALLTFLEKSAKEMGYIEIRLETRHINYRAVNFYMKWLCPYRELRHIYRQGRSCLFLKGITLTILIGTDVRFWH